MSDMERFPMASKEATYELHDHVGLIYSTDWPAGMISFAIDAAKTHPQYLDLEVITIPHVGGFEVSARCPLREYLPTVALPTWQERTGCVVPLEQTVRARLLDRDQTIVEFLIDQPSPDVLVPLAPDMFPQPTQPCNDLCDCGEERAVVGCVDPIVLEGWRLMKARSEQLLNSPYYDRPAAPAPKAKAKRKARAK